MQRVNMFNGCLRSIPKFGAKPEERWQFHEKQLLVWFEINSIEHIASVNQQKLAIIASLQHGATRAIELHGPSTTSFTNAASATAYLEVTRLVFLPRAESNLSRMDFKQYRQGRDEPISEYATTKLSLYHSAEPNQAARSYAYLRSEMLRGIFSGYVKNEVIRMNPLDEATLLEAMVTCLGQAREAYQLGVGVVPNLDGLASTTKMMTGKWDNGGGNQVEPMEIGAITDKRRCFNCDQVGHLSRECRKERVTRNRGGPPPRNSGGMGNRNPNEIVCLYCNKKGHKQPDCYKKKRDQGQGPSTQNYGKQSRTGYGKPQGVRKTRDEEDEELEDEEWTQDQEDGEEGTHKIGEMTPCRSTRPATKSQGFHTKTAARKGGADRL